MKLAAVFLLCAFVAGVRCKVVRTTVGGQKCLIPFTRDGKLHYDCPLADRYAYGAGYRWCPTDKDHKKFAFCANAAIYTDKSRRCMFPFMYGQTVYDRCTTAGDTKPWCFTDEKGNWDYCDYCVRRPCQNGGACTQVPDRQDYTCKCTRGFKGADCEIPTFKTCEEAGLTYSKEIKLNVKGHAASFYCRKLSGGKFATYLSLPYSANTRSEFYSRGRTTFRKIRLNMTTLEVDRSDRTFTYSSGTPQLLGYAAGCRWNRKDAFFRLDLRLTPFKISKKTSWGLFGSNPVGYSYRTNKDQIHYGYCGGQCGGCQPKGGKIILDYMYP